MTDKTDLSRAVVVKKSSTISFPISAGETTVFQCPDGHEIGSFNISGVLPASDQHGVIVLSNVPGDGHQFFVDVNHEASYQLEIKNTGSRGRPIGLVRQYFETLYSGASRVGPSEPFTISWDTNARKDLDVRVTISITPLTLDHAIKLSYTVKPLAEALEEDRLANRSWIQILIDKIRAKK